MEWNESKERNDPMTLKRVGGSLLLAPVAALLLAATPHPAEADPPFTPSGQAAGGCPPGLAKKNTRCMPPGLYKKYHRGDYIRDWRSYDRLDYRRFGLAPPGPDSRYIRIGGDAYLIAEGTALVLEAISLFNAVGN